MPRPVPSRRRRLTSRLPPDTVTAAEPRHQPPPRRDNPGGPLAPPRRASAAPVADLPCSAAAAAIPPPPPLARELMQQRARKRRPAPPRPPLRYFRRAPRVTTATGEHRLPAKAAGGRASRGRAPSPQERRLKRPPSQHSTAQHSTAPPARRQEAPRVNPSLWLNRAFIAPLRTLAGLGVPVQHGTRSFRKPKRCRPLKNGSSRLFVAAAQAQTARSCPARREAPAGAPRSQAGIRV